MKCNDECTSCLQHKPILYLSKYYVPGGPVECYECSNCRMNMEEEEWVVPAYIWQHKLSVILSVKENINE